MTRGLSGGMRRLVIMLGLALVTPALAAPGSWVGETRGVQLFTPGRVVDSRVISPSGGVASEARILQVRWQYSTPPGAPRPQAWLCNPQACFKLNASRGSSRALKGLPASQPLHFRFRLPQEGRLGQPFRVEGLQVIVNFQ